MRFFCVLAALAFWSAPSGAKSLFVENFENSSVDGWATGPGRGEVRLSTYRGNVSLRLTRDASVVRRVMTSGATLVQIEARLAAQDFEANDACLVEASWDGTVWQEVGRIEDGADDGVTLHRVSAALSLAADTRSLFLGVRIAANSANDVCWVDDISVVALSDQRALQEKIPGGVLSGASAPEEPFSTLAFTPPPGAAAPEADYSGRMIFNGAAVDHFRLRKDDFDYAPTSKTLSTLPPFAIDVVQFGAVMIPVQRGPQPGAHPEWEWIFEPGAIWKEGEDGIAARLSMPFALQERNANCIHNGMMSFQISAGGVVSNLVYQIGSETCAYLQFDLWGAAPIKLEKKTHPEAAKVISAFKAEVDARWPQQSIETLGYADQFGAPEEVAAASMTAFGYADGAIVYTGGCMTRFGPYPFCDVLDLPSYSLAKSIVAGIAAMRLEKLYPGAMSSMIAHYVPQCARDAWRGVTFSHALNMTTGLYDSDVYEEDESGGKMLSFFLAEAHAEKIEVACTAFSRQRPPGEAFVYHTSDTYIFGAAITAFLREKTGDASADIFDDLVAPIWAALNVSPTALGIRRTYDAVRQPFTGWGVTLHRNDIVLIADFLQRGGVLDGEPLLDPSMLAAAMQKTPGDRGLRAVIDTQRYKNGFWAWNAGPAIGCNEDRWVPAMSGYGGLAAALFPNGATYFYVSDGGAYAWRRAAAASNRLDPFCEVSQ